MINTVVKFLDAAANLYPDNVALASDNSAVTFKEYQSRAQAIGTYMIEKVGIFNAPISVYLPKGENALISFMGILYSGNYYSPIAFGSPPERAKSILEVLNQPVVVTDYEHLTEVEKFGVDKERIIVFEEVEHYSVNLQRISECLDKVIDTDPAYVLFTSGSTGKPKGVTLPHRAIIDYIEWSTDMFKLNSTTVLGSQAPFHFDASMPDIFTPLFTGSTLHIIPEKLFMFPLKLVEYINKQGINTLIWVPSALMTLTNRNVFEKTTIQNLRLVMFCGEVMPNKHLNLWRKAYPDTIFVNLYGPTEAAYACSYFIVDRDFQDDEPLPIGYPCRNTNLILLSEDGHKIETTDEIGEICIRGSSLALGYYGVFASAAFAVNPANYNYPEIIYRTGDLGKFNEFGELMYAGRKDFQIKHMGYRIELGEIETAVLSIDTINNGCVLYNNKKQEITLFYEAEESCDKAYIINNISNKIPKYMYPTKFYRFDSLPMNMNGKVDRVGLSKYLAD